jgi:hypothetical protein
LPADGINAAVNWQDYGGSRWQLFNKTTPIDGARKGRDAWTGFMSEADAVDGSSTGATSPIDVSVGWTFMIRRSQMQTITTVGLDTKSVFQVHCVGEDGEVVSLASRPVLVASLVA